jgi:hypothetical protein
MMPPPAAQTIGERNGAEPIQRTVVGWAADDQRPIRDTESCERDDEKVNKRNAEVKLEDVPRPAASLPRPTGMPRPLGGWLDFTRPTSFLHVR